MIFAKTWALVLSGRKTQTLRLAYAGDQLVTLTENRPGGLRERVQVRTAEGRVRWEVGKVYAVQPERCHPAKCHFECLYLREVLDPLGVDDAFIDAEGFDTAGEFIRIWHELHPRNPVQRCWAIGFKLIRSRDAGGDRKPLGLNAGRDQAADELFGSEALNMHRPRPAAPASAAPAAGGGA